MPTGFFSTLHLVVGGWLATAVALLRSLLSPSDVAWQEELLVVTQQFVGQRRAPMQSVQVLRLGLALLAALRVSQLLILQENHWAVGPLTLCKVEF